MNIVETNFRWTGIDPFDRNVFSHLDFIDSDITNVTQN